MNSKGKANAIDRNLTLAEARARLAEFKDIKRIEGKGAGAAIPSTGKDKSPLRKTRR